MISNLCAASSYLLYPNLAGSEGTRGLAKDLIDEARSLPTGYGAVVESTIKSLVYTTEGAHTSPHGDWSFKGK